MACKPSVPKSINMHVDLSKNLKRFYTSKSLLEERPSLSLENCQGVANSDNYIMLGLALENLILVNNIPGFTFIPEEENRDCRLKNNPFERQTSKESRFDNLQRKRDFFDKCLLIQVTELNENIGLDYPKEQPGCTITKRSQWSVDFTGPFCFFKPKEKSRISVHLDLKPECADANFLKKEKTILSDYNALLNTYIAGDATGTSADLTALTTTNFRFSITPPKGLINLSDDFGVDRPVWPTTWKASDIYMGEIEIRDLDEDSYEINTPLVANSICENKCKDNLCTSPCQYSQPVVGEFTLYEVVREKREFLHLWYDGSVLSPEFQGLLYGKGTTVSKTLIESGKTYQIEAVFREPDLDYSYFIGAVQNELQFSQNYIGPLYESGLINTLPEIETIGKMENVPEIPLIQNLTFENKELDGLPLVLASWQSKLNNDFWPPYFEKMCDQNGTNCKESGEGFIKVSTTFTLNKTDNEKFEVKMLSGKRESNIVSNKNFNSDEIVKYDCGLDNVSDLDDLGIDLGDIL